MNPGLSSGSSVLNEEATVSSLIDRDSGSWKESFIRDQFSPHEVDHILQVPLYSSLHVDKTI